MEVIVFVFCFLVKQVSSAMICEESQNTHGLLGPLGLSFTAPQVFGFGFLIISVAYYNFYQNRNNRKASGRVEIEPEFKECELHDAGVEKVATSECPELCIAPGHVVFKQTGVEVLATDLKNIGQQLLRDLKLTALIPSEWEILEEDEVLLSPAMQLTSSSWLNGTLEVRIPHGANMILSCPRWNVILKELQNNKWKATKKTEENGIRKFVPECNHVRFRTDHLSTFVIVGKLKYDTCSLSLFKRMKIAAFCGDTKHGDDLRIRLYFFDDCEWSYEKLMAREQWEGGRLVSSIESLNFSVTSEEDVAITVKDVAGWQLDQTVQLNVTHDSLKKSFTDIPQRELLFQPSRRTDSVGFFCVVIFTQPSTSSETVMYISVPVKRKMGEERMRPRSFNQLNREMKGHRWEV